MRNPAEAGSNKPKIHLCKNDQDMVNDQKSQTVQHLTHSRLVATDAAPAGHQRGAGAINDVGDARVGRKISQSGRRLPFFP
jgi:hypothetical protein